uniref:Uncharacterized protein n=1 Tax=Nymphaea colorata TaxID=210225 RepID=A0A5K0XYX2_9MAGN
MLFRANPRNSVEQNSLLPPIGPRFLSSSSVSLASWSPFLFLSFSVSAPELPSPSPSSKDHCIFKLRNLSPINLVCSPSPSSSAFLHLMLSSSARKRRMSSIGTKGGHGKLKSSKSVFRSQKASLQFPVGRSPDFSKPESMLSELVRVRLSTSFPCSSISQPRY